MKWVRNLLIVGAAASAIMAFTLMPRTTGDEAVAAEPTTKAN